MEGVDARFSRVSRPSGTLYSVRLSGECVLC